MDEFVDQVTFFLGMVGIAVFIIAGILILLIGYSQPQVHPGRVLVFGSSFLLIGVAGVAGLIAVKIGSRTKNDRFSQVVEADP